MAWVTIMVVAFIIAATIIINKIIDYKSDYLKVKDGIKNYIDQEFVRIRKEIREKQTDLYIRK